MPPPFRAGTTVEEEGPALSRRDIAARARRLRGFLRELEDSPPVDGRWTAATNRMWLYARGDRGAKWARHTDDFLREAWPNEFTKENT
tara:strand:+ start:525 stop:788 length:264 start_codon:yes stop_codon:yes gene_type:complete